MQLPTCTGMRVRSVNDAEVILHAVKLGHLPMIKHRLGDEERTALRSGCIYVWEERSNNPLEATGQEIQRFTEGRSWGPSRARDNFLLYFEKESANRSSYLQRTSQKDAPQLIKQTYSVYVDNSSRKWHLNAYYTHETLDSLYTIDSHPILRTIRVPPGTYVCARNNAARRPRQGPLELPPPLPHSSTSPASTASWGPPSPAPYTFPPPLPLLRGLTAAQHPVVPPAVPIPSGRSLTGLCLAPLEYLQSISPPSRDPVDDEALRQFHSS